MARPEAKYRVTAEDKTKQGLNSVRKNLGSLKTQFAAIGAASGAVFAVFSKSAFSAADDLNKLNDQLNISTEALSQYQFVAQQTGVEFNTLTTALQRLGRRVSEAARGTGVAKDALAELGVDAQKLNKLELDQQFEVLADAFQDVADKNDKVRLAFKLFDTEGVRVLRTMKGGAEAIRELRGEADNLGFTLDQEVADSATDAVDAIGRLRAVFKASGVEIVRVLGPAIAGLANWLSEKLPRAVKQSERFLVALRIGLVETAAKIKEGLGDEEAARNLRDLANVYRDEFDGISKELEGFNVKISEGVDAADFMDESLKRNAKNAKAAKGELAALNKELARAKAITEGVRTPLEVYNDTLEEYQRLLDRGKITQETFNRAIEQARDTLKTGIGIDPTPLQEYQSGLKDLESALQSAAITFDEYAEGRFKLEESIDGGVEKTKDKIEETKTAIEKFGDESAQALESTFADFLFDPFNAGLDDMVSSFADALRRMAAEAAASAIINSLTGGTGSFATLFAGAFGGGQALGGPVRGGTPYLVGERGPELFVPSRGGGNIVPNGQIGQPVVVNVTAGNSVSRDSAMQVGYDIGRQISDSMRRNG